MDTRAVLADIKAELRYVDTYGDSEQTQIRYLVDLVERLVVVVQEIDQRQQVTGKDD